MDWKLWPRLPLGWCIIIKCYSSNALGSKREYVPSMPYPSEAANQHSYIATTSSSRSFTFHFHAVNGHQIWWEGNVVRKCFWVKQKEFLWVRVMSVTHICNPCKVHRLQWSPSDLRRFRSQSFSTLPSALRMCCCRMLLGPLRGSSTTC